MRVTDNRYRGELEKFDLAMRLIRHEARTGKTRAERATRARPTRRSSPTERIIGG